MKTFWIKLSFNLLSWNFIPVDIAIKNLMGNTGYYEVDYELFDMLDDKSTTCNNDPKYGKD